MHAQRLWTSRACRIVCLLAVLLLEPMRSEGQGQESPMPFSPMQDPGRYLLAKLGPGLPWQLPPPGDAHNGCLEGDMRGMHFSPDGSTLIVEVDGTPTDSLCLYNLKGLVKALRSEASGERPWVQVTRLTAATVGGSSKSALSRSATKSQAVSEREPSFHPSFDSGGNMRVAFTREEGKRGARVYGVDLNDPRQAQIHMLDGRLESAPGPSLTQPRFFPSTGHLLSGVLALVETVQGPCGKARILLRAAPETQPGPRLELTWPCEAASAQAGGASDAADRYAAWNPTRVPGQLAFIRVIPGKGGMLCLQDVPTDGTKTTARCGFALKGREPYSRTWPTFTGDGRYLLLWSARFAKAGGQDVVEQLEMLELSATGEPLAGTGKTGPTTQVVLDQVRANLQQPPALVPLPGGGWRILAVSGDPSRTDTGQYAQLDLGLPSKPTPRYWSSGLTNLKAIAAARVGHGTLVALSAQAYGAGVAHADRNLDKVFIEYRQDEGSAQP